MHSPNVLHAAVASALVRENFPIKRSPPAAARAEPHGEKPRTDLSAALAPLLARVRTDVTAIKNKDGKQAWTREPITPANIAQHLAGTKSRGVCPIKANESTTMVGLLDLDSHKGETSWADIASTAEKVCAALKARGAHPIAFRSSGGNGIHIYIVWDKPQDAYSARVFLRRALADAGYLDGTKGVSCGEIEVFPKQDNVPADGFGNQFILPLAGKSVPLEMTRGFEPMPPEYALRIPWTASQPVPKEEKKVRESSAASAPSGDLVKLKSALGAIPNDGDGLGYDDWRNILFAIHHATNGSPEGLELAHEFSARSVKYDADVLENTVWPYIRSDREKVITERTIYKKAREHGWQEDSRDDFSAIEGADPAPDLGTPDGSPSRFPAEHGSAFAVLRESEWLIKNVLPDEDVIVAYGESGAGKSFIALDMGCAIALGATWRGHKTRQGAVVYIAAEGAGGFRKRLLAYGLHHGINLADLPLWVIADTPNMLKRPDVDAVIKSVRACGPVSLVILDTLAQSIPGGNENSGESMGLAIAHCRGVRKSTGATVMLIHHAGKDSTKGARGWSGLRAAADAELEVTRDGANRTLKITKQKDGEDGKAFGFTLLTVPIGTDEDEDAISSCVVAHGAVVPRSSGREVKGVHARRLLRLASDLQQIGGGGPGYMELIEIALADTPLETKEGEKDNRRGNIKRALDKLIADENLRFAGGAVLLPDGA